MLADQAELPGSGGGLGAVGCADGMSNKEIAQTIFVTVKTVEVHLTHAYRKLEISSRPQLGMALRTPAPGPAPASA